MSVYTTVTEAELGAWLRAYPVGTLVALEPIAKGIENSNFFVTTTRGRYVLTLFERLAPHELPFYLELMAFFARHGIPCPAPVENNAGSMLSALNGKPAALVTRLPGVSVEMPTAAHCAALGTLLARMHLAGRGFAGTLENPRGPKWWRTAAREVRPFLSPTQAAHLDEALRFQSLYRFPDLPRGAVHADLFRDNALFDDGRLSGVIDFYFAGIDCLLYDCAVCANDWCLVHPTQDPRLDEAKTRALLEAYARERPFTALERGAWPVLLRAAALRFWLSRLRDLHLPRPGALVHAHDPEHFETILRLRSADAAPGWPLA
ncbi:MAG: homoserine kinase [Burkholderiales bacterium]|nr:homoserine kinase [Burkholderiales bacterium]